MQLPRVIAERAIHVSSSNGWPESRPKPMKFLVDLLTASTGLDNHLPFLQSP